MMDSFCLVEVKVDNQERFFKKCRSLGINIYETQEDNKKILVKIKEGDVSKLKKIWFIKYSVRECYGMRKVKNTLKKEKILFFCVILGFFLLHVITHVILSVEVIHSSKEIRNLVSSALEEKGIKKYSLKKSYQELEKIKREILEKYQSELEWMEIEELGMKYKVRVEERKKENAGEERESCHLIAKKDGIVKYLKYDAGQALVKRNDYVKSGDILISGIIYKDEEEKGVVCASGEVMAEVWYDVKVSLPLTFESTRRTGKERWNIKLENNLYKDFLFKSRIKNYEEEKTFIKELIHTKIFFVKQFEVEKSKHTYTADEAEAEAQKQALEKLKQQFSRKDIILDKKVLKKEENNGIMNIEFFVSVLEDIASTQEFRIVKGEENGDARDSN